MFNLDILLGLHLAFIHSEELATQGLLRPCCTSPESGTATPSGTQHHPDISSVKQKRERKPGQYLEVE
jgi:hypothetical protein